jgi:hypothetical protein
VADRGTLVDPTSGLWTQALGRVAHDTYHLPEYVHMDASYAGGAAKAFLYSEDTRTFLLPLILRPVPGTGRYDAVSPYGYPGPISNADDAGFWTRACQALRSILSRTGVVACFVRIHPILQPPVGELQRVGVVVMHGRTVSIDLRLSEEQMWGQIRENHRRQIRRARGAGCTVTLDPWDQLDDFISMYHETMRRVGADAYYFFGRRYFERLHEEMGHAVWLACVRSPAGQAIGGGVFFERCGIVQYHLGATRTEFLSQQPTKLMFDEVRRWAQARGNTVLHLGGGVGGEGNPLFRFKAGFSHRSHPFYTWRIVADDDMYARLSASHDPDIDPTDHEGFFPAYRRPAVPASSVEAGPG